MQNNTITNAKDDVVSSLLSGQDLIDFQASEWKVREEVYQCMSNIKAIAFLFTAEIVSREVSVSYYDLLTPYFKKRNILSEHWVLVCGLKSRTLSYKSIPDECRLGMYYLTDFFFTLRASFENCSFETELLKNFFSYHLTPMYNAIEEMSKIRKTIEEKKLDPEDDKQTAVVILDHDVSDVALSAFTTLNVRDEIDVKYTSTAIVRSTYAESQGQYHRYHLGNAFSTQLTLRGPTTELFRVICQRRNRDLGFLWRMRSVSKGLFAYTNDIVSKLVEEDTRTYPERFKLKYQTERHSMIDSRGFCLFHAEYDCRVCTLPVVSFVANDFFSVHGTKLFETLCSINPDEYLFCGKLVGRLLYSSGLMFVAALLCRFNSEELWYLQRELKMDDEAFYSFAQRLKSKAIRSFGGYMVHNNHGISGGSFITCELDEFRIMLLRFHKMRTDTETPYDVLSHLTSKKYKSVKFFSKFENRIRLTYNNPPCLKDFDLLPDGRYYSTKCDSARVRGIRKGYQIFDLVQSQYAGQEFFYTIENLEDIRKYDPGPGLWHHYDTYDYDGIDFIYEDETDSEDYYPTG